MRLVCACGYARWYHLLPTGRGQVELVAIAVPWPVWAAAAWLEFVVGMCVV